jgi:hypothetical protein
MRLHQNRNASASRKIESISTSRLRGLAASLVLLVLCAIHALHSSFETAQPMVAADGIGHTQRADLVGDIIDIIDDLLGGDDDDEDGEGKTGGSTNP